MAQDIGGIMTDELAMKIEADEVRRDEKGDRQKKLSNKLKKISTRSQVRKLQRKINSELSGYEVGDKLKIDGIFGPNTKKHLGFWLEMEVGKERISPIIKQIESNIKNKSPENIIMDEWEMDEVGGLPGLEGGR